MAHVWRLGPDGEWEFLLSVSRRVWYAHVEEYPDTELHAFIW